MDASTVRRWIASLAPPTSGTRGATTATLPDAPALPDAPFPDAPVEGYEEALVSRLRALEDLKCAASAAQARAALALDTSRRRAEAAAGVPAEQRGRGVGAEVALARRESPHQGSRLLGLARALVGDLPHTLAALESGVLNEWRATLIVRETICLRAENRQAVDAELAADTGVLEGVGTQGVKSRARKIAYRLEPEVAVARARRAVSERYVSCRPAPDTMAYLTALLPAAEAISAYSALSRHADTRISEGGSCGRGRGQLMADAFVERLTGAAAGSVRTEVQLIMTDRTLLQGDSEPAYLPGYGSVPAQIARDLLRNDTRGHQDGLGNTLEGAKDEGGDDRHSSGHRHPRGDCHPGGTGDTDESGGDRRPRGTGDTGNTGDTDESGDDRHPSGGRHPCGTGDTGADRHPSGDRHFSGVDDIGGTADPAAQVWLRRLYTAPDTGRLVAMDSRARLFPPGLRRLIAARDATCRTPYCDAPIRHADHILPWRITSVTTAEGGQGLCESCNYIKEASGWSSQPLPGPRHAIERRTPTGHTYVSAAPPLPGTPATATSGTGKPGPSTYGSSTYRGVTPRPDVSLTDGSARLAHSVIDLVLQPAAA
ncbi:HNH endonuclease signature motif containing protein [Arthrobacter agilis]|uniref:HNH endonuclease signature motif containing protein n=1 Tax=Arthrobacter agilis TaxID=37921 RepID=UPI002781EF13|nr:HNH endonuclease signature motif containing protein [Arthrobacter agilis]MDQ0733864.1 hypothetical protein [Arthrobacter agilis]